MKLPLVACLSTVLVSGYRTLATADEEVTVPQGETSVYSPPYVPARITFDELLEESHDASGLLWKTLEEVGMISITEIPDFNKADMLEELEECIHGKKMDVAEFKLDDGTRRLTVGTRTTAGKPDDIFPASRRGSKGKKEAVPAYDYNPQWHDPPPTRKDAVACRGLRAASVVFRAAVQRASEGLAVRLSRYAGGATIMSNAAGEDYGIDEVINQGVHLEHFHSYYTPDTKNSAGNTDKDNTTIDWHIDQGLVLLFTPGQQDGESTSGFFIQLNDGSAVEVDFDATVDDLVIMLGDGINQHFNPVLKSEGKEHHKLRAVPHALTLPKTTNAFDNEDSKPRLWYGRMVLPPADALSISVGRHLNEESTFGNMRSAMTNEDQDALNLPAVVSNAVGNDLLQSGLTDLLPTGLRGMVEVPKVALSRDDSIPERGRTPLTPFEDGKSPFENYVNEKPHTGHAYTSIAGGVIDAST